MPGEEIVTKAKVQRESGMDLPVVLNIGAELEVAKVPDVRRRHRGLIGENAGIHICELKIWRIGGKEQRVEEVVGRPLGVPLGIFNITAHVGASLEGVFAFVPEDE